MLPFLDLNLGQTELDMEVLTSTTHLNFYHQRQLQLDLIWVLWNFAIFNRKLLKDSQIFPSDFYLKQLDR